MPDQPMIAQWRGRFLEDLSKEELIEAVKWLGKQYTEEISGSSARAKVLGRVEMLRRGG